jgi:hypothetical protein
LRFQTVRSPYTRLRGVQRLSHPAQRRRAADRRPRARPSGGASRTIDASKRGLAGPMTGARKEPVVFVELDTRQDADDTVSLEWDRDTGETQIVVADIRDECLLVFPVPGANSGDAFRHPFRDAQRALPTHRPSSPSAATETRGARLRGLTTEATRAERHWRTVSAHAWDPRPRSRPPSTSTCKPPARSPSPKPTDAPASTSLPCPAT